MDVKRATLICLLAGAFCLMPLSSASAQEGRWVTGDLYFTTTTGLTTAAVVGGVVLTILLVLSDDDVDLEAYLRDNAVAVQHDLHTGAGDTARDLAGLFGVADEEFDEFAAILFEHRRALSALAEPGRVDRASAQLFARIVISARTA